VRPCEDRTEHDLAAEYDNGAAGLKKDREEGKNKLAIVTNLMKDRCLQMSGRMLVEVAEPFLIEYLDMMKEHSAGQASAANWQGGRALRMWMWPVAEAVRVLSNRRVLARLELDEPSELDQGVKTARIVELFELVLGVVTQRCWSQWIHYVKVLADQETWVPYLPRSPGINFA
jgi:hypothetical protein